jgi:hypothetical protein
VQIVISEYLREVSRIVWSFILESQPPRGRREAGGEPQLPL